MERIDIFSPFYVKERMENDHEIIKSSYIESIVKNYKNNPNLSSDWQVHTSYGLDDQLENKIDWELSKNIYKNYVDNFLFGFFGHQVNWEFSGGLWYTAYGPGQTANIHEHIPDLFSFVHFLKFDPQQHWPVTFINPLGGMTKYLLETNKLLKENINFNNQTQSLFHPRFTPMVSEGDLICFPSTLEHMVEKSYSDELRVTIAFNVNLI
jgi:hypothetical protein